MNFKAVKFKFLIADIFVYRDFKPMRNALTTRERFEVGLSIVSKYLLINTFKSCVLISLAMSPTLSVPLSVEKKTLFQVSTIQVQSFGLDRPVEIASYDMPNSLCLKVFMIFFKN